MWQRNMALLISLQNDFAQLQNWLLRQTCIHVRYLEFCARWLG